MFLHRYKNKTIQGLTLVELLIVIAIIGILAGAFGIGVSKWRAKSRDSQRITDIRALQQGLAFYYYHSEDSGDYPIADVYITGSDSVSTELINSGAISIIPTDPLNTGNYQYHYCSLESCTGETDGSSYHIEYWMETGSAGKIQGQNFATP